MKRRRRRSYAGGGLRHDRAPLQERLWKQGGTDDMKIGKPVRRVRLEPQNPPAPVPLPKFRKGRKKIGERPWRAGPRPSKA